MLTNQLLKSVEQGFSKIQVDDKFKTVAWENIKRWLEEPQFSEYRPQIEYLITQDKYPLLLDSFYQVIPFGTGGRRGPVGIGPNRINPWAIMASAQGHSDYLIHLHGEEAKKRGLVLAYDVRHYPETGIYSADLPNPVKGLSSKDLALYAAEVYAANGIKVFIFKDIRSTPELSFAIRKLHAIGGDVFSASHNPKEDNGKKVYIEHGGQLIPPHDQELSEFVAKVSVIKSITIKQAKDKRLFEELGSEIDKAYLKCTTALALTTKRNVRVVYSPLHGVGMTSVYETLKRLGFDVVPDKLTSTPDGWFTNIKFNIPNPEVEESFENILKTARQIDADIALSSDPDADRTGLCVKVLEKGKIVYRYLNGNEIGIILTKFLLSQFKQKGLLNKDSLIIKTCVSAELTREICRKFNVKLEGDLLVGFKYVAEILHQLDTHGKTADFIFGFEESHSLLFGAYTRDKDAASVAVPLCELAATLKEQGKTICDYLDDIYREYGYHVNHLHPITMLGAQGFMKIQQIQDELRKTPPKQFGGFKVARLIDRWQGSPHLSETDTISRNVLCFELNPPPGFNLMKITVRPSGTEPRTKIYFEVGALPLGEDASDAELAGQKAKASALLAKIETDFVLLCYKITGIDMPERGLRLSPLIPVEGKLQYFQIEKEIVSLKGQVDKGKLTTKQFQAKAMELLKVFGADPIEKVSGAFKLAQCIGLREYLGL